jgi:hypothetical protein
MKYEVNGVKGSSVNYMIPRSLSQLKPDTRPLRKPNNELFTIAFMLWFLKLNCRRLLTAYQYYYGSALEMRKRLSEDVQGIQYAKALSSASLPLTHVLP